MPDSIKGLIQMKTKTVLALCCAVALAACGGGGHSPTAPAGFTTFATVLVSQGSAPTIEDAKLSVDGVVVAESAATTPQLLVVRIKDIKLTDRSASLATGQSIDYTFDS
jgi:hypothetical protein